MNNEQNATPRCEEPETILAVDYGECRVGLALCTPPLGRARPLEGLKLSHPDELLDWLATHSERFGVELILVGLPRSLSGELGKAAEKVLRFVEKLRETLPLPVETWDERLTTRQAERMLRDTGLSSQELRGHVDSLAAKLLLENYLQAREANRPGAGRQAAEFPGDP